MAFKIPNFYAQNKQKAFAKGPEASTVPSPLNVSYDEAYDNISLEKKKNMTKEQFKEKAKKYNTDNYGTTEPTKASKDGKLNDKQNKALVKSKEVAKKNADAVKAKKASESTKTAETTKTDEDKKVTPKNARRARRAERIDKRAAKKKGIKEVKDSGLKGKAKREAKRAVRDKVGKTKVGKFLKKTKDAVVGDGLGNKKKEKKSDTSVSDSERSKKRQASGNYNKDGSPKSAEERGSALAKLTAKERKAAKLTGRAQRVSEKALKEDLKNQKPTPTKPLQEDKEYGIAEGTTKKSRRKIKRADKIQKKADKAIKETGGLDSKSDATYEEMRKKKDKVRKR